MKKCSTLLVFNWSLLYVALRDITPGAFSFVFRRDAAALANRSKGYDLFMVQLIRSTELLLFRVKPDIVVYREPVKPLKH